jgi:hypothetical protein
MDFGSFSFPDRNQLKIVFLLTSSSRATSSVVRSDILIGILYQLNRAVKKIFQEKCRLPPPEFSPQALVVSCMSKVRPPYSPHRFRGNVTFVVLPARAGPVPATAGLHREHIQGSRSLCAENRATMR